MNGVTNVLADAGAAVSAGDVVTIYCTGLGVVTPAVAPGSAAPASPVSRTVNTVSVTVGGVPAVLSLAGQTSPPVTMAVR